MKNNIEDDIREIINEGIKKIVAEETAITVEKVKIRCMELAKDFKYKYKVSHDPANGETNIVIQVRDIDIQLCGRL